MTNENMKREEPEKHDEDCDEVKQYSDGLFTLCLCEARLMNTFVGAKFVKPIKGGLK